MAKEKDWILFFDEADALFGKRTATQSSQDRYANQEVAYLLQRTEDFRGIVILASNRKGNMDNAFTRRLQTIVYFPIPEQEQRLKLWNKYFSNGLTFNKKTRIFDIAKKFKIPGGDIVNVLKYCAIQAAEKDSQIVETEDLVEGIKREYRKKGLWV